VANFGVLRQTLCDSLAAATGLQAYPNEPEGVSVPCIVVRPAAPFADYRKRLGRSVIATWRFDVVILAGRNADGSAHDLVNEMVSPDAEGIVQVINNTRVNGQSFQVVEGSQYGTVTVGGATYIGAQLLVELLA